MTSDVQICNITLSRVGISMQIQQLTERTKEAIACNLVYANVRDRVLSAAPWPFATRTVALQLTGTAPQQWTYQYEYPNDCLEVRGIYPPRDGIDVKAFRQWMKTARVEYEVQAGDADQKVICTDIENAVAVYTRRVTDPQKFSALFGNAFAWALAAEVAIPLAKGIDYAKNANAAYLVAIGEAFAKAQNEQQPGDAPESEFLIERL